MIVESNSLQGEPCRDGRRRSDAEIIVVNEQTNVTERVAANSSGLFTIPYLQAGKYSVTISRSGFNSFKQPASR